MQRGEDLVVGWVHVVARTFFLDERLEIGPVRLLDLLRKFAEEWTYRFLAAALAATGAGVE